MRRHKPSTSALDPLTDIRFLAALGLLVLNDHLLKAEFGNWLTGKLSDVAGLVVAPVIVAVIARSLRLPSPMTTAAVVVGSWFTAIKIWAPAAAATEQLVETVTGAGSTIVVDPTDLIGLAGLVVSALIVRRPRPQMSAPLLKRLTLGVGLVACLATSSGNRTPVDLGIDPETGEYEIAGWSSGTLDREEQRRVDRLIGSGEFATETCRPAEHGGDCFRIVGGRIERQGADGDWNLEWALFDEKIVHSGVGGGLDFLPSLDATDIVSDEHGQVVVAYDGISPVFRTIGGEWLPPASTYRPIGLMVTLMIAGFGGVALALGQRRVGPVIWAVLFGAASSAVTFIAVRSDPAAGGLLRTLAVFVCITTAIAGLQSLRSNPAVVPRLLVGTAGAAVGVVILAAWKYVVSAPPWLVHLALPVAVAALLVEFLMLVRSNLQSAAGDAQSEPLARVVQ